MATSLPNIKVILTNTVGACDIQVNDANNNPVDATGIKVTVLRADGTIILTDDFNNPPVYGTHIVKPNGTVGYYYYEFGADLPEDVVGSGSMSSSFGDYLLQWTITGGASPAPETIIQNVKVVGASIYQNVPYLRLMIDKARKAVDPNNDVFLGYTDSQLIMFMEGGLQIINGYQPETIAGFNLYNFPWRDYRHIANEAALMSGVLSQQLFAIDTDMPNYSDQGTTFVIAHQPQLAALLNQVTQRLDKAIPQMKLQFVTTGSLHIEQGPTFRLATLLTAAPSGSLFRNLYFKP